jgi:hypothetical protein
MSSRCPREARRQPGPDESGVIAVLSAIGASALLACVALAMNLGNIAQTHQHTQSAVDAAALTGADLLGQGASPSSVVPVVEENVAENFHSADLAVGSGSDPAFSLVGNVFVQAPSVGVVGSISTSGNVGFSVPPETGIAPFADPLAYLRPPDPAGLADQGSISLSGNNTVQLSPGIYGSIRLSGNSEVTLAPGLYILTGGFEASGNTEVQGAGVTLYFT